MDVAVAEEFAKALKLPRPFLHEVNRSFVQIESWNELVCQVALWPIRVQPLGYYRTPDGVDVYVFECVLGRGGDKKSWKLYRRYRHFQSYVKHSTEFLASMSMVVPKLSQAYMQVFRAKHCKDRLEELHHWLGGVIDNTHAFCHQRIHMKAPPETTLMAAGAGDTHGSSPTSSVRSPVSIASPSPLPSPSPSLCSGPGSCGSPSIVQSKDGTVPMSTPTSTSSCRKTTGTTGALAWTKLTHLMEDDPIALVPALLLCCFLFSGANNPFPHVFRGMPSFAFAVEEVNILLTKTPVYPSKLRSSLGASTGIGVRLTAHKEHNGVFTGAIVAGFLRDVNEIDPQLAQVQIGSRLVRINGMDVSDELFEQILVKLRDFGLPLRLCFVFNPHLQHRNSFVRPNYPNNNNNNNNNNLVTRKGDHTGGDGVHAMGVPGGSFSAGSISSASTISLGASASFSVSTHGKDRCFSVDSRRKRRNGSTSFLLGSVLSDLFGGGGSRSKQRCETITEVCSLSNQVEVLSSWDDIGGDSSDVISRGFFTCLSRKFLTKLKRMDQAKRAESIDSEVANQQEEDDAKMALRKGQGVWTSGAGPMGLCFGACKIRDVEAAMLEIPPVLFSSRLNSRAPSEKQLRKGFVLHSINNETTFGLRFEQVMKLLNSASRPTSLCFRWFKDFSPFLETELTEQQPSDEVVVDQFGGNGGMDPKTGESVVLPSLGLPKDRYDPAKAFEFPLECIAESQSELCNDLQLALVENASVRNELANLHEKKQKFECQQHASDALVLARDQQLELHAKELETIKQQWADTQAELDKTRNQLQATEMKLSSSMQEYHQMLETAHANALERIAAHEERLVKESNKSIEQAKILAERRMQKVLDQKLEEMKLQHEEYLQKLAEEHAEEIDGLNQQVAVWRHQVEVLTEAEKRNYVSSINNNGTGLDFHRSRFGLDNGGGAGRSAGMMPRTYHSNNPPPPPDPNGLLTSPYAQERYPTDRERSGGSNYTELSERNVHSPSPSGGSIWGRVMAIFTG